MNVLNNEFHRRRPRFGGDMPICFKFVGMDCSIKNSNKITKLSFCYPSLFLIMAVRARLFQYVQIIYLAFWSNLKLLFVNFLDCPFACDQELLLTVYILSGRFDITTQ